MSHTTYVTNTPTSITYFNILLVTNESISSSMGPKTNITYIIFKIRIKFNNMLYNVPIYEKVNLLFRVFIVHGDSPIIL